MVRTPLAVVGATGRMGRAIAALLDDEAAAARFVAIGRSELSGVELPQGAVLVDFSSPDALPAVCALAQRCAVPLVSGTTGLAPSDQALLDATAREIPVLHATNTSLGVALLRRLVREAASALGPDFDVEIVEAHHRRKVDAPSGTALTLLGDVQAARSAETAVAHGRSGLVGARPSAEIGMHAVRGGTVVGEHTVHFLGPEERIELTHRAESRDVFARGAIRAALWLREQPAGRYTMDDVMRPAAVRGGSFAGS